MGSTLEGVTYAAVMPPLRRTSSSGGAAGGGSSVVARRPPLGMVPREPAAGGVRAGRCRDMSLPRCMDRDQSVGGIDPPAHPGVKEMFAPSTTGRRVRAEPGGAAGRGAHRRGSVADVLVPVLVAGDLADGGGAEDLHDLPADRARL